MEQPEGEIFIIPARLEECDNLESLRKWQWVDLFEESGYKRLKMAFHEKALRVGAAFSFKVPQELFTTSDEEFRKRIVEELEAEGEYETLIWSKTKEDIKELVNRISRRLKVSMDEVLKALKK